MTGKSLFLWWIFSSCWTKVRGLIFQCQKRRVRCKYSRNLQECVWDFLIWRLNVICNHVKCYLPLLIKIFSKIRYPGNVSERPFCRQWVRYIFSATIFLSIQNCVRKSSNANFAFLKSINLSENNFNKGTKQVALELGLELLWYSLGQNLSNWNLFGVDILKLGIRPRGKLILSVRTAARYGHSA